VALSARNKGNLDVVVLAGEAEGGGVALVAAVRKGGAVNAGELIADAARLVKGGGGRGDELAVAGGKEVGAIDAALEGIRRTLDERG
jgi:alanyl-tRNA synthetase